jgi:predicted amidohydrolase YtcJ
MDPTPPPPVTLLTNARIYTMDPTHPQAEALAWQGERIIAVGSRDAVAERADTATTVIDAGGRTVIPGLIDSHIHFTWYAAGLRRVNLEGVDRLDEALRRVGERAAGQAPGTWVPGHGWDNNRWGTDVPTRADLDRVAPGHPVLLSRKDGHSIWVNSLALERAGITRDTPDPPGGRIGREANGAPNGMLYEGAAEDLVYRVVEEQDDAEDRLDTLREAIANAQRAGLTGFHNCEDQQAYQAFADLEAAGLLGIRVLHLIAYPELDAAIAAGRRSGDGSARLRTGPVKIFSDGSLGSLTAEMLEPFAGTTDRGVGTIPQAELEDAIRRAGQAGIAVAVHAIGDAANRRVLDAFAAGRRGEPELPGLHGDGYTRWALRHRIEHAQHLNPADYSRFAEWGVIASMQPIHCTADMEVADRWLGARAAHGSYAWRSLRNHGARLAFGSDCPVETFDPLLGLYAAVTRQDVTGHPPGGWHPAERLDLDEAVYAYTQGAAFAAGEEAIKGSLTPGKLADLVVLSTDIFTADPAALPLTRVQATILGGTVVWDGGL